MKSERRAGVVHHFDTLIKHRTPKNLLVYCPACPEVGWNLEPRSDLIPREFRYIVRPLVMGSRLRSVLVIQISCS